MSIYPVPKPGKRKRGVGQKRGSKPRPGRLKGAALEQLRRDCFERDRYLCRECGKRVYWTTAHMAHIKAKRIGLDVLSNVRTECGECHHEYHQYGPTRQKPCKSKKELNDNA